MICAFCFLQREREGNRDIGRGEVRLGKCMMGGRFRGVASGVFLWWVWIYFLGPLIAYRGLIKGREGLFISRCEEQGECSKLLAL